MAEVMIRVCDVDLSPSGTIRKYTVTVDDHTTSMDLCDKHAGPFAPTNGKPAPKRGNGSTGRKRRNVATMEEIEAMKAETKESPHPK